MVDKKYDQLIDNVINLVGEKRNILAFSNCMTRLRITIKDKSLVKNDQIRSYPGVMGTQFAGDQYQIIIGPNVTEVSAAIQDKYNLSENVPQNDEASKKITFGGLVTSLFDAIAGSITPVLPVLIGAGMINVLLVLATTFGWLSTKSPTYTTLQFISDSGFYFFPVLAGAASARRFNLDLWIGIFFGAILIHPTFIEAIASGNAGSILGLPIYAATYTSTIFPVILTNFVASYVYHFFNKHIPNSFKSMLVPFLTILIIAPLELVALAPVGAILGNLFAAFFVNVYAAIGFVGLAILGAVYPWLVATGMHQGFGPYLFQTLSEKGQEGLLFPLTYINNVNQGIAAFAVSLKSKDSNVKSTATLVAIPAIFAGVTEPAMFGVNLRYRQPLYAAMIGNFIACGIAGLLGVVGYTFVGSFGLFGLPAFIGDKSNNLFNIIISIAIGSLVTFIGTLFMYKDNVKNEIKNEKLIDKQITITSPITGEVVDLEKVPDEMFASHMLGEGVAIIPKNGKVFSPYDAKISAIMPSKHAIGLLLDNGVELLIHVGIETVNLQGKYFDLKVQQDQLVQTGDLLLEFDKEAIEKAGYQTITPVIVTNSAEFQNVFELKKGNISAGDLLFDISKEKK